MLEILCSFLSSFRVYFRTHADMQLEVLALRHQVTVLQRTNPKPKLKPADRRLWVWLSRSWSRWRSALVIVKPDTVVDWHRRGFRWYWTWKVRHGKAGRLSVPKATRELIRTMSRDTVLWGAPRIHGELLKLGITVSQASVAKYMVRHYKPPSQTWRTFLENHVSQMVSVDFLHRTHYLVRDSVCICRTRARPPTHPSFQRDGPSDGGVDRPANRRSLPL
jgi:putative transposase